MLSSFYKSQLVATTNHLLAKALINDEIEVTDLNIITYPDSITVEMNLPPSIVVNKIKFLDAENHQITEITGLNIDTSVSTVFSHNIHFLQGGV